MNDRASIGWVALRQFYVSLAFGLAWWCCPHTAAAQTYDQAGSEFDWRREQNRRRETPQSWAFEVRFGPYRPEIDNEFSAAPGPYERVFGDDARVYVGVEVDYQALRIPHVGTLGPGASWGFTQMKAKAKISGTNVDSAENTSLWIMPMYLAAVLRADVLPREAGVPLVPYAKVGVGWAWWKASNESGTSQADDGTLGKGTSYGLYFAPGLMFQLDALDHDSATQLDNSVGVNHSYVFFEWMRNKLDGFGSGDMMQVGTSTWVLGLAFEI